MSNLAQTILLTVAVTVGAGAGTYGAGSVVLPPIAITLAGNQGTAPTQAEQSNETPAASTPAAGVSQVIDENGPSAADFFAAGMACSDLRRFGKSEEEAIKTRGTNARFLIHTIKAAGFKFEDCL